MRFALGAGLYLLLSAGAVAQHRGGGGHIGVASGVRAGGVRAGGIRASGRIGYAPRFRSNFGIRGFRGFYPRYWGSYWPWFGDYYSGVWDSSDYDNGYAYGDSSGGSPNVTVVYPPPAEPVYPTVINITAHPVMHEYRQPEDYGLPSEQPTRPVLYLIAFNDHVIRAATTYWVENGRLRYLDIDHKPKEAPLSSIDLAFSAQLNRERRVPFSLQ